MELLKFGASKKFSYGPYTLVAWLPKCPTIVLIHRTSRFIHRHLFLPITRTHTNSQLCFPLLYYTVPLPGIRSGGSRLPACQSVLTFPTTYDTMVGSTVSSSTPCGEGRHVIAACHSLRIGERSARVLCPLVLLCSVVSPRKNSLTMFFLLPPGFFPHRLFYLRVRYHAG